MGKRGRPPKPGHRYACGKLKPTGDPISPAAWARVRADVAMLVKDERLASEVGRLSLHQKLTDEQTAAAFRVGAIYGAFERHKRKRRSIRSPSYEQGFGGSSGVAEELLSSEAIADLELQIRASEEAFMALQDELRDRFPRRTVAALEALCVDDRAIGEMELDGPDGVRSALLRLARFFGTSGSRRSQKKKRRRRGTTILSHPSATAAPVTSRAEASESAIMKVLRVLRPDLDEKQRAHAVKMMTAMRDREVFNRSKGHKSLAPPRRNDS